MSETSNFALILNATKFVGNNPAVVLPICLIKTNRCSSEQASLNNSYEIWKLEFKE